MGRGDAGTGTKGCRSQSPRHVPCRARCRCGWTSSPPASGPPDPLSTSPPASPRGECLARPCGVGRGHPGEEGDKSFWSVPPLKVRAALRGLEHTGRGPGGHQPGGTADERYLRHRVSQGHRCVSPHRGGDSGAGDKGDGSVPFLRVARQVAGRAGGAAAEDGRALPLAAGGRGLQLAFRLFL